MSVRGRKPDNSAVFNQIKQYVIETDDAVITPFMICKLFKVNKNYARTCLYRLKKAGYIIRTDVGYKKSRPPHEVLKPLFSEEKKPEKKPDIMDLREVKLHHLTLSLSKEEIEHLPEKRFKIRYILPPPDFPRTEEMNISELFTPLNRNNILHRWKGNLRHNEQNKSYSESVYFGDRRRLTIHIYGNGTVVIYIEASENPLDEIGFAELRGFLRSFIQERCGLLYEDLEKLLIVKQVELSEDKEAKEKVSMSITKCITFDVFDNIYRLYEKTIGGKEYLRSETMMQPKIPLNEFWEQFLAFKMGGVNMSATVTSLHMLVEEVKKMQESVKTFIGGQQHFMQRLDTNVKQLSGGTPVPNVLERVLNELDGMRNERKVMLDIILELQKTILELQRTVNSRNKDEKS